ncbi:cell division protein SepF [Corynebacterium cystitidis]|uniref:cell division protein SepF n=1 Tax=Corynebacterium cystitidis TaxID=35757 RepID=UPI00211E449C|nr:cell division protein SepF [Corynebacterium cystitidis]
MSFVKNAKEFFGFTPYKLEEDAYYDEPRYGDDGSAAYAPEPEHSYSYNRADRTGRASRGMHTERAERGFTRDTRFYTPSIVVVTPRTYDDAKDIGEPFRDGDAVVMDLTELDRKSMTRMIDFSAGLCFGLRGQMHNLAKYADTDRVVFAIVPENGQISAGELERVAGLR